jgi:hypothetical protein
LLDRLTRVEAFERYLRKAFLGQKTFSGEVKRTPARLLSLIRLAAFVLSRPIADIE